MKRVEVHIAEGETNRRLGTLEYDELRGKEISSFELDGDYILHPSVPFLGPDIGLFRTDLESFRTQRLIRGDARSSAAARNAATSARAIISSAYSI